MTGAALGEAMTPVPYLVAFAVVSLTAVPERLGLESLYLDSLLALLAVITAAWQLALKPAPERAWSWVLVCLLLIGAPLLSALANTGRLDVVDNAEYRSWVKMLLLVPLIFIFLRGRHARLLVDAMTVATLIFAGIFLYRFFVLGEAREFDLRPLVNIKNGDPNFACVLFTVPIPFLLQRTLDGRWWYGAAAILLTLAAVVSESRMGVLALTAALLYLGCRLPARQRRIGLVLASILVAVALVYGGLEGRFAQLADESNRLRWRTYGVGLELFAEHPFLGAGWDTAASAFFRFAGHPRLWSEAQPLTVHNTFLQLLAELGVYGFSAYLALIALVAREVAGARERAYAVAALSILLLNFLTLPLEGKDFAVLWLAAIAAAASSLGAVPDRGHAAPAQEVP